LYKKAQTKEGKGNLANWKDISYDVQEFHLKTLVEALALSTTSFFAYNPSDEYVRSDYIKELKLKESDVPEREEDQDEKVKEKLKKHK